jgi:hypothetical protein
MSGLINRGASLAILLVMSLLAHAESWVTQYPKARASAEAACGAHDLPACQHALLDLESLVDGRVDIEYRLARVEAELGLKDSALHRLESYARSGLDLGNPAEEPVFATLNEREALHHIADLYREGLVAQTAHVRVATLVDPDLVTEDIVCERESGSFLLSSVRERKILGVKAPARVHDFVTEAQTPLWGMFALGLDASRNILWASTSTTNISPPIQAGEGRSAVLALNAQTGAVVSRYELPRGARHAFGDMTISPAGRVYVSDGLGGGVYTVIPGRGSVLTPLIEPGELVSPQTPALTPDGSRLLVPDYVRGIAIVDLKTRSVSWIRHPPELAVFGIDGLYLDGRTLVAVQNGTTPERIIMMQLADGLTRVERWSVLLARAPGLGDPTHGCLRGREFYFIANSGWDQFEDDGQRRADSHPSPAEIWKIRIPSNW